MPEGIEIEMYRQATEPVVGRSIAKVISPDTWFLKAGATPTAVSEALLGQEVVNLRRVGKLLLLDIENQVTVGLRFGMTGRILVDDAGPIDQLEYAPTATKPEWIRFQVEFDGGGSLAIHDPRRLGGVELDPDESKLGPDLFSVSLEELATRVFVGKVMIKGRLLDQKRVAGIGNLICDETLWKANIRPDRPAGSLSEDEQRHLHRTLQGTIQELLGRGGSHMGELQAERSRSGHCPLDGAELTRIKAGGRTTYFCATHQI